MSVPVKHHFLPEFYLRHWAGDDGRVWDFRRPHLSIVARRSFPSETGFQRYLYSLWTRAEAPLQQALETQLMSPIDDDAADAMAQLISKRQRPASEAVADAWARFVVSQIYRNPRAIEYLKDKVQTLDLSRLEGEYATHRRPEEPATIEEFLSSKGPEFHEESFAALLAKVVRASGLLRALKALNWHVLTLNDPAHGLIVGDRPIVMSNGIMIPDGFLLLPLGPNAVFLASDSMRIVEGFQHQNRARRLDAVLNDAISRQADFLVVGASDHHKSFLERRLCRDPTTLNSTSLHPLTWKPPT